MLRFRGLPAIGLLKRLDGGTAEARTFGDTSPRTRRIEDASFLLPWQAGPGPGSVVFVCMMQGSFPNASELSLLNQKLQVNLAVWVLNDHLNDLGCVCVKEGDRSRCLCRVVLLIVYCEGESRSGPARIQRPLPGKVFSSIAGHGCHSRKGKSTMLTAVIARFIFLRCADLAEVHVRCPGSESWG